MFVSVYMIGGQMKNDKNIKNNNETKICKCCGRELPLSSFAKSGKKYTRKICKSCENKQRREKREAVSYTHLDVYKRQNSYRL